MSTKVIDCWNKINLTKKKPLIVIYKCNKNYLSFGFFVLAMYGETFEWSQVSKNCISVLAIGSYTTLDHIQPPPFSTLYVYFYDQYSFFFQKEFLIIFNESVRWLSINHINHFSPAIPRMISRQFP